ncbi:hypothetical protein C8N40_11162 [Pontibacter mucosus]|uniref:Uncharacterized protein n=1 Tax=Pontibacter mucosus TaxID=1649266 RepID=A0A2T5YCX8_9BACT|nr:hypothetical protein C8N40_11162 [Pontibacter mucosus]
MKTLLSNPDKKAYAIIAAYFALATPISHFLTLLP